MSECTLCARSMELHSIQGSRCCAQSLAHLGKALKIGKAIAQHRGGLPLGQGPAAAAGGGRAATLLFLSLVPFFSRLLDYIHFCFFFFLVFFFFFLLFSALSRPLSPGARIKQPCSGNWALGRGLRPKKTNCAHAVTFQACLRNARAVLGAMHIGDYPTNTHDVPQMSLPKNPLPL